jgi:hypothetical protein
MTEEREHLDDENGGRDCWCHPEMIFETDDGRQVWVHKGAGEELPPSWIIAQAVYDALTDGDL